MKTINKKNEMTTLKAPVIRGTDDPSVSAFLADATEGAIYLRNCFNSLYQVWQKMDSGWIKIETIETAAREQDILNLFKSDSVTLISTQKSIDDDKEYN